MTIVFVDLEHSRVLTGPIAGETHRVRLLLAQERLAEAAGESCDVVRFEDVSVDGVRILNPSAIAISGNTTDWIDYDVDSLKGLLETIRLAPAPILGICGGHQVIGYAHGAAWGPIGRGPDGAIDPDPHFAPGLRTERGFLPVEVDLSCPLIQGLGSSPIVLQSHYWQLTDVPTGFKLCAASEACPIQALSHLDRLVFGVQFHPERYDASHRDGETILRNFFNVARAGDPTHSASTISVS